MLATCACLLAAGADARAACPDREPLRRAWFGDLHVHTVYSLDASTQDTRTRPADAYRFARGEAIELQPFGADGRGLRRARLSRPLDFAAVTDHAELLGEWKICNTPHLGGHDSIVCRVYRRWPRVAFFWMNAVASRASRHDFCGEDGRVCREAARGPWRDIQRAAHDAYRPCEFTTFVAYEWTGAEGFGENLHRNVIFSGDAVPELPASFVETPSPPELWARLRRECRESGTGCDAAVIPHNSNLSGGQMFRTRRDDGSEIDAAEARERADIETLVEIMQHKGDSECSPGLETEDELCNFEKLPYRDFTGRYTAFARKPPVARQFVRNVLKLGLAEEARLGVNPFRYGIVASTDTHLGTPGLVQESADYPGHGGAGAPAGSEPPRGLADALEFNPGGLAVLWAEENTREALFAAIRRREAYGTSGPRLALRFFGGWDYPAELCEESDLATAGYAGGVPMGGVLAPPPAPGAAPVFAVSALRDPGPDGAALQRLQIVKGWLEDGAHRERVVEVAGWPDRAASVDPESCEPRGAGADALCAVWRDPAFEPSQRAFYYARAVQNPTCRWSQQVCAARGVRCDDPATVGEGLEACCAEEHVRAIQERAWSSPIWYAP
jgi:hypothetical protein